MESLIHNQLKTLFTLALHDLASRGCQHREKKGLVLSDGFRVVLPETNAIVQPDCFYVEQRRAKAKEGMTNDECRMTNDKNHGYSSFGIRHSSLSLGFGDKSNPTCFFGAPEVIVEVASPTRLDADRVWKMEQYARAGVSEYWLALIISRLDANVPPSSPLVPATLPGLTYDLFFRIFSLRPTGVYRPTPVAAAWSAQRATTGHSQFFNVTVTIARDNGDASLRDAAPHAERDEYVRCRLTLIKADGERVMFVV